MPAIIGSMKFVRHPTNIKKKIISSSSTFHSSTVSHNKNKKNSHNFYTKK